MFLFGDNNLTKAVFQNLVYDDHTFLKGSYYLLLLLLIDHIKSSRKPADSRVVSFGATQHQHSNLEPDQS